jgi:hypothetical protein
MAQSLLMKLVTDRRDDGRPAHIKRIAAELTDDHEAIMLNISFSLPIQTTIRATLSPSSSILNKTRSSTRLLSKALLWGLRN